MAEPKIPPSAASFHLLSDDVELHIGDVTVIVGKHKATLHRLWMSGKFPKPHKDVGGRNAWKVGVIRAALAAKAA